MLFSQNIPPSPSPTESKSLTNFHIYSHKNPSAYEQPRPHCFSQPLVAWLSGQKSCNKLILLFISFHVQSFILHKIILPVKLCMHKVKQLKLLSHVQLFVMPWSVARQAPLSMGFSRQEYLSRLPCPPPGGLPDPGIELESLMSPALAGRFFTTSASCCCYC